MSRLVAGIYHATPKVGSNRFPEHRQGPGQVKQVLGEAQPESVFVRLARMDEAQRTDRADERFKHGAKMQRSRFVKWGGGFYSATSKESLLCERKKGERTARKGRKCKATPAEVLGALKRALEGTRTIQPIQALPKAVPTKKLYCSHCKQEIPFESETCLSDRGKLFCGEACDAGDMEFQQAFQRSRGEWLQGLYQAASAC